MQHKNVLGRKKYDVIIIGSGITGLSTAYHLKRCGISNVALVSDPAREALSWQTPACLFGTPFDNFTRLSHAHGAALAQASWQFGIQGFDDLRQLAKAHSIATTGGRRWRLIVSDGELLEAEKAVSQLANAGFPSRLIHPDAADFPRHDLTPRVQAIQDDGAYGGWIDLPKLFEFLWQSQATMHHYNIAAEAIESNSQEVRIVCKDPHPPIKSELVILACHSQIGQLVPSLRDALIPIADQWAAFHLASPLAPKTFAPVAAISANHGHEWGFVHGPQLCWGGARYLRPLAGIGDPAGRVVKPIAAHLQGLLQKTFPHLAADLTPLQQAAGSDIRPCDELPIIGPMFGEERVLLASGYMGTGLNFGFLAGKCLASLVSHGQSAELPRYFWPERLRSLASN